MSEMRSTPDEGFYSVACRRRGGGRVTQIPASGAMLSDDKADAEVQS
jgi:hypothetical protein